MNWNQIKNILLIILTISIVFIFYKYYQSLNNEKINFDLINYQQKQLIEKDSLIEIEKNQKLEFIALLELTKVKSEEREKINIVNYKKENEQIKNLTDSTINKYVDSLLRARNIRK